MKIGLKIEIKKILGLTLVVFLLSIIAACGVLLLRLVSVDSNNLERMIIRSLHAPGGIPSGYVKVLEDKELDRAFYINKDVKGFSKEYYKVRLTAQLQPCKVIEQYENYMLVHPYDKAKIYTGMSGSKVTDENGEEIGFISELTADGLIKVISSR